MKKIKQISIILVLLTSFLGCNDTDFLETAPKDELSKATIFSTYNNIKLYSWGFYDFLEEFPRAATWSASKDLFGDLMQNGNNSVNPGYLDQNYTVPINDNNYSNAYVNIRKVNIMLDALPESPITAEQKAHWRGVGLFFRAHEYFKLLERFGGVPWIENEITDEDIEELYKPRDSRDLVAGNILRDLNEAVSNIFENGDGPNTINKDVALALLSRFSLFEGTWRKYHNLGDANKYLQAAATASSTLVVKYPTIMSNYDAIYNSEDLGGKPGILLYKHYVLGELTHWVSTNTRSTNNKYDITRKGIDKFLTEDGLPIYNANNTLYQGDKDHYAEFRNRDSRILTITPPPYKIVGNGTQTWSHTGNLADQEWFGKVAAVTGGYPLKELPDRNWSGRVTDQVPNFNRLTPTQTGNGYRFWKVYNDHNDRVSSSDFNDFAIFRMGEIYLINAEAKYELGQFNQTVANATINKLRTRAKVAPMDVGAIGADFDPKRDPSVDPVLWEIRRERAVELMGDGYRREDLRRWKKMSYATETKLGRWIVQSNYSVNLPIQNNAPIGYIQLIPKATPAFPDHYYLFPIPLNELASNPNLEQNPNWQ
ncbi:RagB/SusD family nutrient uptake outer membrane protein [Polaribacter batillariae]|uniref:RagB/SusD family nutrient uptake outer membrane protein n=1 Tax=Polaribacter batillariae TaxID=2808900 RepID=A0ABX7SSX7_9FLAO|nr:RagB/SusD family nutrient uptake outer membrane protein [Polaribacter batillariae]QTD37352.1 RagB/SusD family nutrient uptake outer membrane protein [Polaribacter batillariae]